jgi:hypothetical protein
MAQSTLSNVSPLLVIQHGQCRKVSPVLNTL